MECIPEAILFDVLFDDVVVGLFVTLGEPLSDFVVGRALSAATAGLSEFTLTWRRLVPKLLTDGEDCRLTFGWGIFSPNLLLSSEDEIGLVNARVVIGDCVICAAAAALTRFAAVLLM